MEKYILDTNLFFNMEAGINMGKTTIEVMEGLTFTISELKKQKRAEFFMPPRIVDELLTFFEKEEDFVKKFLAQITIKSPDISRVDLPATLFYSLVDDIRKRSYRGLNVAEEEVEKAARSMMEVSNLSKKDFQIKSGEFIKKLRDRYRQATRFGFLDSVADLDLIVLAKVTDGFLVSTDEGVITWGRMFGVKELPPHVWKHQLDELLSRQSHQE